MKKSVHEYLRSCGVRPSVQRVAIMDYLLLHRTHPTAEEIYCALAPRMPTLSKMTVYNTLNTFVDAGAIHAVDIDAARRHFDGDTSLHAHFMCKNCGAIMDVAIKKKDRMMGRLPENVRVDDVQLLYKGLCNQCLTNKKCFNHEKVSLQCLWIYPRRRCRS